MFDFFAGHYPFYFAMVLITVGLYGMTVKRHLVKKIIGMTIFQTGIYVFWIQGSSKQGGTAPVVDPEIGLEAALYVNPLPQALIITAIVVGIAVTGIALSFLIYLSRHYESLHEDDILNEMSN